MALRHAPKHKPVDIACGFFAFGVRPLLREASELGLQKTVFWSRKSSHLIGANPDSGLGSGAGYGDSGTLQPKT